MLAIWMKSCLHFFFKYCLIYTNMVPIKSYSIQLNSYIFNLEADFPNILGVLTLKTKRT